MSSDLKSVKLKSGDLLNCVRLRPLSDFATIESMEDGGLRLRTHQDRAHAFFARRPGGLIFEEDVEHFMPSALAVPSEVTDSFEDVRGGLVTQIVMKNGTQFKLAGGDWHIYFFQLPSIYTWEDFDSVVPFGINEEVPWIRGIRHFTCLMNAPTNGVNKTS